MPVMPDMKSKTKAPKSEQRDEPLEGDLATYEKVGLFLRSFVKRAKVDRDEVTVHYKLPLLPEERPRETVSVLPIDTFGGPWGTVPELLFEKKELIPALQQLLISYSKPTR